MCQPLPKKSSDRFKFIPAFLFGCGIRIRRLLLIRSVFNMITLTCFSMIFPVAHIRAQEFSCTSSYYCSLDLRNPIYTNAQIETAIYNYGKSPQSANFKDWEFPEDCGEDTENDKCRNDNGELFFVVHYPKNTVYQNYSTCPLPVIFMFHPGGFADCSSLENVTGIQFMCNEFAKRGFVVFNVEYRRGRLLFPDPDQNSFIINSTKTISQQVAVYRAVQDARGAIRSALKMQADGVFGTKFMFDETKVFGAGASAGAGTILSITYLQKQDMIDEVSPGFKVRLGNTDIDYYYAPTTYPLPEMRGVLSMWGNFPMPGSIKTNAQAATFFNRNNYLAPLIAFQGKDDGVVDYDYRYERYPPDSNYGDGRGNHDTTSFCIDNGGLISINPIGTDDDLLMIGPLTLRDLLMNAGKEAEVYLDCDMGHGLDADCCPSDLTKKPPNCTQNCIPFLSNFGTASINSQQVQLYMVQRTSVFFQSTISNSPINGTSFFTDCENLRNSCSPGDNDNNCNNTDQCQ